MTTEERSNSINLSVKWYAWDLTTFEKARLENKAIFLSIGYASCHWCHVMDQESFRDPETAELLNQHFICIRVDAYERPDIDKVYQSAYHLMHQQPGGWPLNAFLTPSHQVPFLIGTYFPKFPLENMPSFKEILIHTAHYYEQQHKTIEQNHSPLVAALGCLSESPIQPKEDAMNERPLTIARIEWENDFDDVHGGFGTAPKFPHAGFIQGLMEYWYATCAHHEEDKSTLKMACLSLQKMAEGGIFDQIGGGFFRYTVDASWRTPHFEKMLYDNGLLLALYAQLFQCVRDPFFEKVVRETAGWLLEDARNTEGTFYASVDSDVGGHEGQYYLWNIREIDLLFTEEEKKIVNAYWGFDVPSSHEKGCHPYMATSVLELAKRHAITPREVEVCLEKARACLRKERSKRIAPKFDRKVITAWNALVIKGLSIGSIVLHEPVWLEAAEKALNRLYETMWFNDRLYTGYQGGRYSTEGYLDDYAFLIDALLNYLQCRWNTQYFHWMQALLDRALDLFEDTAEGGFYFTPKDAAALLFRPKVLSEDSMPSGGGVLTRCALLLGHVLGEVRYLTAAEQALHNADYMLHHIPSMHSAFLSALELYVNPTEWIIIRTRDESEGRRWASQALKDYHPRRLVLCIPADEPNLPSAFIQKVLPEGCLVAAYRGNGLSTQSVITDFKIFSDLFIE